jgi:uncharacterized membrane protein (UPF0127 family)
MMPSARTRRRVHAVLAFAVAALCVAPAGKALGAPGLPTTALSINGHKIIAEVASTLETRATGLMNRFSLKPDTGMLFVFERPEPLAFWMKNTFIPLSIAFLDVDGRILNIEDMAPQTETSHWSKGPALFALEMRKGWFVERGIRPGDRVEGVGKAAK